MDILLNSTVTHIDDPVLENVVQTHLQNKTRGVAVAVNNVVIPKHAWSEYTLQPNDQVLIIKATQGG